jgi:hypothetical protein
MAWFARNGQELLPVCTTYFNQNEKEKKESPMSQNPKLCRTSHKRMIHVDKLPMIDD